MSDFLSDDFTIELKLFFLNSVKDEVQKFKMAADHETWEIFLKEVQPQMQTWSQDAITNEFGSFSMWLKEMSAYFQSEELDFEAFLKALNYVEDYTNALLVDQKDSPELKSKYDLLNLSSGQTLFLHCFIEKQDLLIPAAQVLEVLGQPTISALPLQREDILGMLAFRGEAVPVLNLNPDVEADLIKYYVICEVEKGKFALPVGGADHLVEVDTRDLQKVSSDNSELFQAKFLSHFVRKEDRNMLILDLEKMV